MPKALTITKQMIIDAAFSVVQSDGFDSLSARSIARRIGCSTQPIYCAYENMEDLKQDVIARMVAYLQAKISGYHKTGKPFLDLGLGYVNAAYTDSVLFRAIYMDNIMDVKLSEIVPSEMLKDAAQADEYKDDNIEDVAIKGWIFAHG